MPGTCQVFRWTRPQPLALPSLSLRTPRASLSAPLRPSPVPSLWPWGTDASWWVQGPGEGELRPHHTLI